MSITALWGVFAVFNLCKNKAIQLVKHNWFVYLHANRIQSQYSSGAAW